MVSKESKFRVNDHVRRTGCAWLGVVTGGIYTVKSLSMDGLSSIVLFGQGPAGFDANAFELASLIPDTSNPSSDPLKTQISGDHYKSLPIQPIEYIHANSIPFAEGCVIKYVSRWKSKGGIRDLEKARHFIDLLIALEQKAAK